MRFFALTAIVAAVAVLLVSAPAASATPSAAVARGFGTTYSPNDHYGAPIPPWQKGCKPGWYYGNNPTYVKQYGFDLIYLKDSFICELLSLLPFNCLKCPKPHPHPPKPTKTHTTATSTPTGPPPPPPPPSFPGWNTTMYNNTAAVQADDYMTFGLVDTVQDCLDMCLSVSGCAFVNTYHDVNGKDGSPLLTCALFSKCHTAADADNRGGQSQPDGSVDFIINSDGYCKL